MGSWAADLVPRCVWPASPSAPWLSPLSRLFLGSSQVSDPSDGDKCFALKTSVRPPWPANEGRGAGTRPSGPSVAVVGSLCDVGGGLCQGCASMLTCP